MPAAGAAKLLHQQAQEGDWRYTNNADKDPVTCSHAIISLPAVIAFIKQRWRTGFAGQPPAK